MTFLIILYVVIALFVGFIMIRDNSPEPWKLNELFIVLLVAGLWPIYGIIVIWLLAIFKGIDFVCERIL